MTGEAEAVGGRRSLEVAGGGLGTKVKDNPDTEGEENKMTALKDCGS